MKKIFAILMFVLISTVSCASCVDSAGPKKPDVIIQDNLGLCSTACIRARAKNCDEGKDLIYPISCVNDNGCYEKPNNEGIKYGSCKNGQCVESCEAVCYALVLNGRYLNLQCWDTIEKCSDIENVCRKENKQ